MPEEGLRKTPSPLIYAANPTRLNFDAFLRSLKELFDAAGRQEEGLPERLAAMVKSYHQESPNSAVFIASQQKKRRATETTAMMSRSKTPARKRKRKEALS